MDFEMIFAMLSFAALIIVWAFAPQQSPVQMTVKAPVKSEALA